MPTTLVRRTLAANAVFSAGSAIVLLAGARGLDDAFGVGSVWLVAIGVGLLPFAAVVASVARTPEPLRVRLVIVADVGWVIGAAVLLVLPDPLSATGKVALGVVTAGVAVFAGLQAMGLRRVAATGS